MKRLRMAALLGFGWLAACSSSNPLAGDGGPREAGGDRSPGTAGAGAAGSSASGAAGSTGAGAAGSGAAGTTTDAGSGATGSGAAGSATDAGSGAAGFGAAGSATDAGPAGASPDGAADRGDATDTAIGTEVGVPGARDVDVLFMIDDSSSIAPLQQKLLAAFPTYIQVLESLPGGLPNLHLAVVSSSLGAGRATGIDHCPLGGDQGVFRTAPLGSTCTRATLGAGQRFLMTDRAGNANFTGDLGDMFSCIAALGSQGCGFEHQLASVLRALGADGRPAPAENAGFLRANALLQVVLLTNEDDCSAPPDSALFDTSSQLISDPLGPLQSYRCNEFGHLCGGQPPPRTPAGPTDLSGTCVSAEDGTLLRVSDTLAALAKVKSSPAQLLVSVIAGPPTPYIVNTGPSQVKGDQSMWPYIQHSCQAADGTYADPAVRLKQWADAFAGNGLFENICGGDLTPVANQLATALAKTL